MFRHFEVLRVDNSHGVCYIL